MEQRTIGKLAEVFEGLVFGGPGLQETELNLGMELLPPHGKGCSSV